MRLYYFTDEKHAIENIEKQHLKVSFSDLVNDPFELRPFKFGSKSVRRAWGKCIENHATQQGFISFAENYSVPPMWAHYANNHEGLCYGFDVPSKQLLKIEYISKLKEFDELALSNDAVNKETSAFASRTKSNHWQYENEWRFYVSLSRNETNRRTSGEELFFLDFGEELRLREVIIGARSKISSESIRSALKQTDSVAITTARPAFEEFKMVPQKLKSLQK